MTRQRRVGGTRRSPVAILIGTLVVLSGAVTGIRPVQADTGTLTPVAVPSMIEGQAPPPLMSMAQFTGADPMSNYAVTVNWGDGTTTPGATFGSTPGTFQIVDNHTYNMDGSYGAAIAVTDVDGQTLVVIVSITISEDVPSFSPSPLVLVNEGRAFNGTVAGFTTFIDHQETAADFAATINWGDGTTSTGTVTGGPGNFQITGAHTYADENTPTITTTLTEVSGLAWSGATATPVQVFDADTLAPTAPTVILATEDSVYSGAVSTFTDAGYPGQVASDFTSSIDWGDGTTSPGTVVWNGFEFEVDGIHTYADEGSYSMTVNVADDAPASALPLTTTPTASVGDAPLSGTPVSILGTEGTGFSGTVASFTDANTGASVSDFTATIDWGDGTTTAGVVSATGGGAFDVSGSHTYALDGAYTAGVTLTDIGGSAATVTDGVSVVEGSDASSAAAPFSAVEGTAFGGVVATITDPGGDSASAYTATINWGDGTSGPGTVGGTGPYTVSGAHTYADAGPYVVTVSPREGADVLPAATQTITVTDVPLTIAQAINPALQNNLTYSGLVATGTDPAGKEALSDYSATINWGDGTTSAGTVGDPPGTLTVSGTHTYAAAGTYTVTASLIEVGQAPATAVSASAVLAVTGPVTVPAAGSHPGGTPPALPLGAAILLLSGGAALTWRRRREDVTTI